MGGVSVENMFDRSVDARRTALNAAIASLPTARAGAPVLVAPQAHAEPDTDLGGRELLVPGALEGLLPVGLQRGSVVGVDGDGYLTAALVAAAVAGGGCAALLGAGEVGLEAVVAAGGELERIVLVEAGERWGAALEVLCGAVDLVVMYGQARVAPSQAQRIAARLRSGSARTVLLATGPGWSAPVRLRVEDARWIGLGEAVGELSGRRTAVVAEGAGYSGRAHVAHLWLPAADGTVREQGDPGAIPARPRHLRLVGTPTVAA